MTITRGANQKKVWFGLSRRPPPNGHFEWTDASETFKLTDYETGYWKIGESWQNECVVIILDTKKWETTNCQASYPFVCKDSGKGSTDTDYPDDTAGDASEEKGSATNTLALAIVLPVFALCYGGSCLLYCIHKLHRNCKRKKRMLLEKDESNFTQFEPETKPSYNTTVPSTVEKSEPPLPVLDAADPFTSKVAQPSSMDDPAEESQPEPSRPQSANRQKLRNNSRGSAHSIGPIVSSRPTTSEGVHLNMDETHDYSPPGSADPMNAPSPPGYYESFEKAAKKKRTDKRRNRLLENALKEARERRARESASSRSSNGSSIRPKGSTPTSTSQVPNDMVDTPRSPAPTPRPNSTKSSHSTRGPGSGKMNGPPPPPYLPATPPDKRVSSEDSSSSLINEDRKSTSSPDDPTKMSISDIIKVKMMMKERKKRVKKILLS